MSKNTPQEQKVLSAEEYIKSVSKQRGDNLVISKKEAIRHLKSYASHVAKQKMLEIYEDLTDIIDSENSGLSVTQRLYEIKSRIDGKQ